ncbi:anti-sigma B factor RsbW [Hazenella sp. IB182357]|uniref:Serine-protein kinase RsbW n=1 Tax=Polycladospora coralii TaxID=2771432 RepID=A0A926RUF3_9BACL|nr:anti-sigma B factor RsbW [Polycladospora coralii]MBD1372299.1 anti-sigma B factor RsbW [Polycladospora coralii]MBS7531511.1 anti-sigma B factor RsbW [Polycladospora coralii]
MSEKQIDFIRLNIPAKPEYVGIARLAVSGVANRMGFSYDEIEDMKLAVAEACTNAVDHAYCGGDGEIEVACKIFSDRIQVDVMDRGNSFDISEIDERTGPITHQSSLNAVRERGLGLYLMKTLMDDVDIQLDQGVVVTMTKFIRKDVVESYGISPSSHQTNR